MKEEILETGIQGLICRQCEDIIIQKLAYIKGIIKVEASYWKGKVTIKYDPDIISINEIYTKLKDIGFPATNKCGKGKLYDLISVILIIVGCITLKNIKLPMIPTASNGITYLQLFLIGLVTGTHCVIMCGGIMLTQTVSYNFSANKKWKVIISTFFYNIGRVIMAIILGFIFGKIGNIIIFNSKAKSMIYSLTGAYVIFVGLGIWGIPGIRKIQAGLPTLCDISKKFRNAKELGPFCIGLLTELLPCASSNSMWILAMTTGNGIDGAKIMLAWVMGTLPCMILLGIFSSLFSKTKVAIITRINVILLIVLGVRMLWMGLS